MVVDASKKKLCSHNVIFIEGMGTRTNSTEPKSMEFQSQDTKTNEDDGGSVHSASDNETAKRWTQSEVWGTDPTRRSKCISQKVLITKTNSDTPEIITSKGYKDAVSSPEAKHWKDVMDYELAKLSEMNTWDEMNESDIPLSAQVLLGMWVHLIKKQKMGDLKFQS